MEQPTLEAQLRESRGKGPARAVRRAGFVPAVIYGHKVAPVTVKLSQRSLRHFMASSGENVVINMALGGDRAETVMLKEVQIDPVTRQIVHADFVRVSLEERVTTHVPIVLTGSAPGVSTGGVQEFLLRGLRVECQAGMLPDHIELDVSSMEVRDQIRVRDMIQVEGMTFLDDPATIIVNIAAPTIDEEKLDAEIAAAAEAEEEVIEEEEMEPEVIGEKGKDEDEEEDEEEKA